MLTRRALASLVSIAAAGSFVGAGMAQVPAGTAPRMKVGVIGSGHIGGTLGKLWVQAGHPVMFSSRHPDELKGMVQDLGPLASAGTPQQAASFGDAVLIAVPYRALPQIGHDLAPELKGKVVLETGNATAAHDGADTMQQVQHRGIGTVSAEALPGVRLVRAFNALNWQKLLHDNHRPEPVAVPIAGDDPQAVQVAEALVRDAGFAPVLVGPLSRANDFAMGSPMFQATQAEISSDEMRRRFAISP